MRFALSITAALFQELLVEQRSRSRSQSRCQCLRHCLVMLLAWVLALGSVSGCVLALHYFSEHMHMVSTPLIWDPLSWGWRDRARILGREAGTAPLQLCS